LQTYCQSPSYHRYNQSFVKEIAKPDQEKNFKIILQRVKGKKLKHSNTQATQTENKNETNDKFKNLSLMQFLYTTF